MDAGTILNSTSSRWWWSWYTDIGVVQFAFIAYHYFHAAETYNWIRVFVSSYVWLTGFGNFSFFYTKGDFGFVRMWRMIWRLNFTVVCCARVASRSCFALRTFAEPSALYPVVASRFSSCWRWTIRTFCTTLFPSTPFTSWLCTPPWPFARG